MNTISDGTIAQQVQRAMNMMRQASGDIDDLGTLEVAPLIPLINTDKLLEQSRAISSLATPGEITSFLRSEKLQNEIDRMFKLKELNLELNTVDNVITITPDQRFIDELKRTGSGAFMVTQNNVDASSQKFESNHPQYVTDQDNFLSHATSSVGGFHR